MAEDNNKNGNGQSEKIRKVLFNEFSLVASVVAIAIGIILFIVRPDAEMKQDVALIKKDINLILINHLPHIQASLEEHHIDDVARSQANTDRIEENRETIGEINIKLERILTILGD